MSTARSTVRGPTVGWAWVAAVEFYRGLMRTSGAMTNRLRRLEQVGLIRRIPDPDDGRGLLVELTDDGRQLVDEIAPVHMDNERAMLAALTPAEQESLAGLLARLLAAREAADDTPPHSGR